MNTYIIRLWDDKHHIMCDSYATALDILVDKANSNMDYVLLNAALIATTDLKEVNYYTRKMRKHLIFSFHRLDQDLGQIELMKMNKKVMTFKLNENGIETYHKVIPKRLFKWSNGSCTFVGKYIDI